MKQRKILMLLLIGVMLCLQYVSVNAMQKIKVFLNNAEQSVVVAQVKLDGKEISLSSPAFLTNNRIVVPVRFLLESVGAIVKWDDSNKGVQITTLNKEIELWLDKNYMNVNGSKIMLDEGSIPRFARYANGENRTMVPLRAIGEALGYKVSFDATTGAGILEKMPETKPNTSQELTTPNVSTDSSVGKSGNAIDKAELMVYNGKVVLRLTGIADKKVKVSKMDNPNRIIYDISDTVFSPGKWEFIPISYDNIEKIRIAQFQGNGDGKENTTRVVFDVVRLSDIDELLYLFEDNSLQIDIRSIESMTNEKIKDTENASKNPNKDDNNTTIIKPSENNIAKNEEEKSWQGIVQERLQNMKLLPLPDSGLISENKYVHILIDPGHGGRDPGTISFNGRFEKDFALATSLKLRDDLQKMGFVVHMTRETDRYPTLMERATMANTLKTDIFISMHANSVDPNRRPNGIEVWYSGVSKVAKYSTLEIELARKIDDTLIKTTFAVNRGVKKAKHVVTANSKMAAILVEAGFLSNPVEEALLFNDSYRDVVARAVAVGVYEFVEKNRTVLADSKRTMIAAETTVPINPSVSKKVKYKVNADALNVRRNPGITEPTIGKVYDGEILMVEYGVEEIKKDGYTWLYTTDNSGHIAGWLAKEFLIEQ